MLWPLVVIRETVAMKPNIRHGLIEIDKTHLRWRLRVFFRAFSENWMERILREHVLDVGHEQFLVLLFVMNSQRDDGFNFIQQVVRRRANKIFDLPIDVFAIAG